MEFSARRRGEIHEGSQSLLPASMDCAPRELESPFARPFRLSGHIVGQAGQMYQARLDDMPLDTPCGHEGSQGSEGSKGSEGGGGGCAAIFKVSVTGLAL